jgi:predicted ATPase
MYPVEIRYIWTSERDLMAEVGDLRLREGLGRMEARALRVHRLVRLGVRTGASLTRRLVTRDAETHPPVSGSSGLFVLTGAPGSGKTVVLDRIRGAVRCLDEPAREVLAEERATGGRGTWDQDPALFVSLLLQRSIEDYVQALGWRETVVFDCGIPDCAVYAMQAGTDATPSMAAARQFRYENRVLFLEPWSDIYETDEERVMSFEDTASFSESLKDVYRACGYTVVEVPRGSVDDRATFVRAMLRRWEDRDR